MTDIQPANDVVEEKAPRQLPEPNPITIGRHHREVLRQITIPFVIGLAVFLTVVVLAWMATAPKAQVWANISTMFLVLVLTVLFIILTAVSAALAYLVIYLVRILPPYTRMAQDYTDTARDYARTYADKATVPIIATNSASATVSTFFKSVFGRKKSRSGGPDLATEDYPNGKAI
jgi:hypothetical protein